MFDGKYGFVRDYDGTKYLVLIYLEKYNAIYNGIRHLIVLKMGISYIFSHNYVKIKINWNDDLPLEEILALHNVVILIKSVWNKNKNQYYYNIFLGKCLYQSAQN